MFARFLALFALMFAFAATPALAENPPPPEARALIEKQLDAFAHDDAAAAYALAAPGIKAMFPDADTFLAMVKSSYAPVYRHRSVEFGAAQMQGDDIKQALTFVDADNQVWSAVYMLTRQPDGSWATTGCVIVKSAESSL